MNKVLEKYFEGISNFPTSPDLFDFGIVFIDAKKAKI